MERLQLAPDIKASKLENVEAKPLNGEPAEYNVPDVKKEPQENTYEEPGLHLHRRVAAMMQDLAGDHTINRVPPILLKARNVMLGDHFKTAERMAHHDHKMFKMRKRLFE